MKKLLVVTLLLSISLTGCKKLPVPERKTIDKDVVKKATIDNNITEQEDKEPTEEIEFSGISYETPYIPFTEEYGVVYQDTCEFKSNTPVDGSVKYKLKLNPETEQAIVYQTIISSDFKNQNTITRYFGTYIEADDTYFISINNDFIITHIEATIKQDKITMLKIYNTNTVLDKLVGKLPVLYMDNIEIETKFENYKYIGKIYVNNMPTGLECEMLFDGTSNFCTCRISYMDKPIMPNDSSEELEYVNNYPIAIAENGIEFVLSEFAEKETGVYRTDEGTIELSKGKAYLRTEDYDDFIKVQLDDYNGGTTIPVMIGNKITNIDFNIFDRTFKILN